ncbi:hypothetical protein LshimejAT787_1900840 [Lyophyllum shimeji]|uniref:F-box domain-containing protein n=1 Tax=Lyophyllum shimeji TaxID=47721 RepID=A0A9P3Q0H3_LYOSH|nr:hypothetical protein LshimejAT787_1900840 [Lyophyllum shimeji]
MSSRLTRPFPPKSMLNDFEKPIPRLPQELVDHIIDHLHDDPVTLNSCALVCHAWLPTSRLHIFSKVSLKVTPAAGHLTPSELCKRLHRLFTASPSIICYVRELEVLEGSPLGGQTAPQAASGGNRSTTWVTTECTFPHLLRMFTHLKRLEFGAHPTTLHWAMLPPSLQSAIRHVFSLRTLTFVRLKSWSFTHSRELAGLLGSARNLQGLALVSVCVTGEPSMPGAIIDVPSAEDLAESPEVPVDEGVISPRRSRLEFLTMEYVDAGNWLLSPRSTMDLQGLRELRVAHFEDLPAVERLLARTGISLEHFHFKTGILDVYPFDLSINANLRSIKLTLEDPPLALRWVQTLLKSISPTNVLEHISLEFFTDLKQMVDGWAELDSLLLRPELSGLRQVEFGLFTLSTSAEFARVTEELAGLGARGILRMYRLGLKNQRSNQQLMPRISRYESS